MSSVDLFVLRLVKNSKQSLGFSGVSVYTESYDSHLFFGTVKHKMCRRKK